MTDPTARDLIQRLADSVELLLLMRNGLTPLVITEAALDEARAYLAQPEPEVPTDEERFEHWWYHEGSAPPRAEDDSEEHTHRTSKIAWLNGAYCARYGNPAPAPPADGEVAELSPAAQAVFYATHKAMAEQQFALSGVPDYRQVAAAALRAVADRVVPANPDMPERWEEKDKIRADILTIATELENQ